MEEKTLAGFFGRLEEVMRLFSISSVNELALKHLGYKHAEKINRLKNPDNNPSAEIIFDIIKKWPTINANWLLTGEGGIMAGVSNKIEKKDEEPTMKEILLVLAEGYRAQVETVKSIESKMAREETLAEAAKNLQRVLGGLETVADIQNASIKEFRSDFRDLKKQKKVPS